MKLKSMRFDLFRAVLLVVTLSGMVGCSSVVKMNVKHAPEVDIGAVRTLQVEPFTVSGQVDLDSDGDGNVWRNLIKNAVLGRIVMPSDVSVQNRQYADLVGALKRNGYFQVTTGMAEARIGGQIEYRIEDQVTAKARKSKEIKGKQQDEEKRKLKGEEKRKPKDEEESKPRETVKRKKGEGDKLKSDEGEPLMSEDEEPIESEEGGKSKPKTKEKRKPKDDGKTNPRDGAKLKSQEDEQHDTDDAAGHARKDEQPSEHSYTLTRNVQATLYFMVRDAAGKVLGSAQVQHASSRSWSGGSEGDVRRLAQRSDLTSQVMDEVIAVNALLVQKIVPYYVMESRVLEECDSDLSDAGNDAAEEGNWRAAVEHWQAMSRSGDAECRYAAEYNLGVYEESMGRLGEALMRFENVYAYTHNKKFSAEAERIRQRMQEEERMRQIEEERQRATPL